MLKRWSKRALESANLRGSILYDDRASMIVLEDLVRFINMEKDSFYRNRDLYLIYKRLCPRGGSQLSFGVFMEAISAHSEGF